MNLSSETILIVDDAVDLLHGLKRLVEPEIHCRVLVAESAARALDLLRDQSIDLVLSDIRMPDMDGMELLERIRALYPSVTIILMTAYGTVDQAVEGLKKGAYDFIGKPLDEPRLFQTLRNGLQHRRLVRKTESLEQKLREKELPLPFTGDSPALKKVLSTIQMVAPTDLSVLITGETGTGKDLAARTIHALSKRTRRTMVVVNCPAIPETLLESELFGHRKGAFTHASENKKGLVELAHGSSLFLDEIGDLPKPLQTKLLRVLQDGEVKPLGDNRVRKVDVRVISSTNRNLQEKIGEGEFREDLYYRLNVVAIRMPSLREMRDDIPLIAIDFLNHFVKKAGLTPRSLSPEAIRVLQEAPWKGNVRQLQNVVKQAATLTRGETIEPAALAMEALGTPCLDGQIKTLCDLNYRSAREEVLKRFTTEYLTAQLSLTRGNVSAAALRCGLERQSVQHLMRKYGISSEVFRKES
jgi:DNA-binding NtrC family response regulator